MFDPIVLDPPVVETPTFEPPVEAPVEPTTTPVRSRRRIIVAGAVAVALVSFGVVYASQSSTISELRSTTVELRTNLTATQADAASKGDQIATLTTNLSEARDDTATARADAAENAETAAELRTVANGLVECQGSLLEIMSYVTDGYYSIAVNHSGWEQCKAATRAATDALSGVTLS